MGLFLKAKIGLRARQLHRVAWRRQQDMPFPLTFLFILKRTVVPKQTDLSPLNLNVLRLRRVLGAMGAAPRPLIPVVPGLIDHDPFEQENLPLLDSH